MHAGRSVVSPYFGSFVKNRHIRYRTSNHRLGLLHVEPDSRLCVSSRNKDYSSFNDQEFLTPSCSFPSVRPDAGSTEPVAFLSRPPPKVPGNGWHSAIGTIRSNCGHSSSPAGRLSGLVRASTRLRTSSPARNTETYGAENWIFCQAQGNCPCHTGCSPVRRVRLMCRRYAGAPWNPHPSCGN